MQMNVYLHFTPLGPVLVNEEGQILASDMITQDKDPEKIARFMYELETGNVPERVLGFLASSLSKEYTLAVEDEEVARKISQSLKEVKVTVQPGSKVHRALREQQQAIVEKAFGISYSDYYRLVREATILLARWKVKEVAEKRDLYVAQAVNALDDVNKTINLFASRVREWYGLHFPELNDIVEDHEDYFKIVSKLGSRSNISLEKLKELGFKDDLAQKIVKAASNSMGAELTEFDLNAIRLLSDAGLQLYSIRRNLEKYIDEAMYDVAPNIRGLVGPTLGARLISLAGGLEKLARLPASTIQVLGAEKALFRALRFGARPPKHGVIFQHPYIHKSPKWQRGKIARALAGKLAIAARIDAFTGEYKADELREDLEKRIEEIKTLYAKPPAKQAKKEPAQKKFRGHGKRKGESK
ncbi:Pre-mRNA processing ribonucleoprotein,-binding region [Thermofilum pendens]|uniref:rRNA biogenesis protein Nop56/Nop58 n=1 Tax=Thermofilum pendens (strain DSM 2475 / Hrk 5) TaxID=368408 RepID=A1RX55_THEPD|nr:Pre-mRNA processing ribonucleoprotein,-binding region [Thermofilum pendens]ABL77785.1 rRNA biogenesis protein Nop56/Nop58 [Thermofilum pendens Hrk 5]